MITPRFLHFWHSSKEKNFLKFLLYASQTYLLKVISQKNSDAIFGMTILTYISKI